MSSTTGNNLVWIWHVGSRGGFVPIAFPACFDSAVGLLMLDADPAAVAAMATPILADNRSPACVSLHRQVAAWSSDSRVELFHTACPFAAGFRRLDPRYRDWFVFGNGDCDYVLGAAHAIGESTLVAARRLDSIVTDPTMQAMAPTVLSIDAQGASTEVVDGADALLHEQIDAVVCEAETIPFYGGVPSFSTLLTVMAERRFLFCGMLPLDEPWASPCRNPIGLRGRPLPGSVDAVFLRDPWCIADTASPERAARYAFVACIMGHPDLAASVLLRTAPCQRDGVIANFARDLRESASRMPPVRPPAFGSSCRTPSFQADTHESRTSPFEQCLSRYGFGALAEEVRLRRVRQMPHACPSCVQAGVHASIRHRER